VGLGVIVYRKIPILANLSEEEMTILGRKKGIIQKIREIDYKQCWLNFIIFLEKFLRRWKIIFLKIENLLNKWIRRLRERSQITAQKSKEWIRQRELKRRKVKEDLSTKTKEEISIKINKEEVDSPLEEESDQLSLSELKKPIKEEQKWIDLIVENPKNITAYKFLGLLYWKQHNYSDAKASLEMAVKLGSKDKKVKEVLEELKKLGVK
jgi:tetratricopeptide (TPR) repeat protein